MNKDGYGRTGIAPDTRRQRYLVVLSVLAGLFALRVAAQFVQVFAPVTLLPPSSDFQGSSLPYGALLSAQIAILLGLASSIAAVARPSQSRYRVSARHILLIGVLYAEAIVLRLAIGGAISTAGPWFQAWISSAFHLVLAAFLIVLAMFRLRAPSASNG